MKLPPRCIALTAVSLALLVVGVALAAASHPRMHSPGDLDRGFGHNGLVVQGFGTEPGDGGSSEAAPMPAGGFVVRTTEGAIGRYLADGSLDPSFGDDGYLLRGGSARAISTTGDGRIYVLGWDESEERPTLRRLLADGTPDRSFAGHGVLKLDGFLEFERAIALPDGGVLLVGSEREEKGDDGERVYKRVYAERLRADGAPDPSYGSGGIASVPVPPLDSEGPVVYTLDGERLLFAIEAGERSPFVLVRLEPDGQVDPGLDPSTVAPEARAGFPLAGIVVEAGGRIVVCGRWGRLLRLLPDGRPDPSFGEGGAEKPLPLKEVSLTGLVARPGGGIFLAGNTSAGGEPIDLVFAGLTAATGALDPSVGAGSGFFVIDTGDADRAAGLTSLADGGALLSGESSRDERDSLLAARLTPAGALDPAFGDGGVLVTRPLRLAVDEATAVVSGPGGTIFAGSRAARRAVVVRFRRDGRLDSRFGDRGIVSAARLGFETGGSKVTDLLRLHGGGLLVAASSRERTRLLALTPDGAIDRRFGDGGVVDSARFRSVTDLVASRAGSVLVAGIGAGRCRPLVERIAPDGVSDARFSTRPLPIASFRSCSSSVLLAPRPGGGAFAILRGGGTPVALRADGTVDRGFELADAASRGLPRRIEAIAVDRAGRLLLGGTFAHRLAVARVTGRGRLDRRFGRRGEALREVGREAQVTALLVEAGGRIVAAGTSHTCAEQPCSGPTAVLARFTETGDADRRFGRAGVWTGARGGGSLAALAPAGRSLIAAGRLARLRDQELLLAKVRR